MQLNDKQTNWYKIGKNEVCLMPETLQMDYSCSCSWCSLQRIPTNKPVFCFAFWCSLKRYADEQVQLITEKMKQRHS